MKNKVPQERSIFELSKASIGAMGVPLSKADAVTLRRTKDSKRTNKS
jgi:hypothetical protein